MSKKIIYLLSLLMALSLVFASCKKNGAGDITGGIGNLNPPNEEDNTGGIVDESTGLINNFDDLPTDKVIKKETIYEGDGVNYLRNPVVVVMGSDRSDVAVFAEKRYKSPGAANDVGINGKDVVDIVVRVSGNAGVRFGGEVVVGNAAQSAADSHGDPVVFKVADDKVVVVATSGGGIARTDEIAAENIEGTATKPASKVQYIVGTLNGESFTWTQWQDVSADLLGKIQAISAPNGNKYTQMAVQAARGYVNGSTLILPVIMAQQGKLGGSNVKELMGVYFVKGTWGTDNVTWDIGTAENNALVFNAKSSNANSEDYRFSTHKATQVIAGTDISSVKFVAVPSPWGATRTLNFGLGSGKNQPTGSQLQGHDGAPGYLTLKWHGANTYNPSTYKTDSANTADKSLFLGVKGNAANVTLYLVDKESLTSEGSYLVNEIGKSGSIDVLGDGTVVTAAEEGGQAQNYFISFTRYTQSHLSTLLTK